MATTFEQKKFLDQSGVITLWSCVMDKLEEENGSGIYIGSGDMPEEYNVQIDPEGEGIEVYSTDEIDEMFANFGGGSGGEPSNAQWVKLGTYDLSLTENQVEKFTINEYNGAPFTIHKAFVYGFNVAQSNSYYDVEANTKTMQIGLTKDRKYNLIFPMVCGTMNISSSANQYYTGVGANTTAQPYSEKALFPSNYITVMARHGQFNAGTLEIWGYIEQ